MKEKDLLLLAMLRANSRETLTRMSKKTAIPISTIFDRLKQHQGSLIKKHTAIIDFAMLGFSTRTTMTLKVGKGERESIRDYLTKHPHVNSVYKINNGFDYLIEAIFRNLKEVEDFLELLEERFKVKAKQVYYIIEDIKREEFLADPTSIELVAA